MATWYTNYLTGNDTTGAGTIANPYKTITKAATVGANNDTINVAGLTWDAIGGGGASATITVTSGSATVTTSQDLTTYIQPGSLITWNDPQWGIGKEVYKVFSVSSTQIVLSNAPNTAGTYSPRIMNQPLIQYYTTTAAFTFEAIAGATGKTGIKVEGGWNSTFTAQNGYTPFVYQGASAAATSGTAFGATPGAGWSFNKFIFANVSAPFTSHSNQWYVGELYFSTTTANMTGTPTTYATGAQSIGCTYASLTGGTDSTDSNGAPGFKIDKFYETFSTGFNQALCSTQINELWFKNGTSLSLPSTSAGVIPFKTGIIGKLYLEYSKSLTTDEYILICNTNTSGAIINDMTLVGNFIPGSTNVNKGIYSKANNTSTNIQYILPSPKKIEDFPWVWNSFSTVWGSIFAQPAYVKDAEGTKIIQNMGCVQYADPNVYDTGTNSLRIAIKSVFSTSDGTPQIGVIKDFLASGASQTITIRMKANTAGTLRFGIIAPPNFGGYNNYATQFTCAQAFNVTTSWADYTFTGLQAAYYYNLFANKKCALVMQPSTTTGFTSLWIDSVTIS